MIHEPFIDFDKTTPSARQLQIATGRIIRQARKTKKLSIVKAAKHLKLSPFYLKALEDGAAYQSVCEVARITVFYGHGIYEFFELSNMLPLARAVRTTESPRHSHLSLADALDCKPVEQTQMPPPLSPNSR